MDKSNIFHKAEKKAKEKKAFATSFITWTAFTIFFIFLDVTYGSSRIEWAFYPAFFWGFGVMMHGLKVFDFFGMGEKWEKEEIRKEIAKRKKALAEMGPEMGLDEEDIENFDLEEIREIRKEYRDSDFV